jgi:hypothetical protein
LINKFRFSYTEQKGVVWQRVWNALALLAAPSSEEAAADPEKADFARAGFSLRLDAVQALYDLKSLKIVLYERSGGLLLGGQKFKPISTVRVFAVENKYFFIILHCYKLYIYNFILI